MVKNEWSRTILKIIHNHQLQILPENSSEILVRDNKLNVISLLTEPSRVWFCNLVSSLILTKDPNLLETSYFQKWFYISH